MSSKLSRAILGLVIAVAAGSVGATPLIASWNYSVTGAFDTTGGQTTFTTGAGCQTVTSLAINWGADPCATPSPGDGRSGIGISDTPATGTVVTNGAAVLTNTYTHFNNVVDGSDATLLQAHAISTLTLTPIPTDPSVGPVAQDFTIDFAETPNVTPCVAASPPGNPCNDIFVLLGTLNNSFTYLDGNTYLVSFFAASNGLQSLTLGECTAAGAPYPCIGFTTVEGQPNAATFAMQITSTPVQISVPEPATLALLGVGLAGLGFSRRRNGDRARTRAA